MSVILFATVISICFAAMSGLAFWSIRQWRKALDLAQENLGGWIRCHERHKELAEELKAVASDYVRMSQEGQ